MSLLNRKAVRERALDFAANNGRGNRFERVSNTFINRIEAKLNNIILDEVKRHPSVGKTLK